MSSLRLRRQPLAQAIAHQTGFGLVETLLVIGAVSLMSLAVYGLFFASDVTAEVKAEQNNLRSLSTAVDQSFGLTGGFSGLTLERATQEGLLPADYRRNGGFETVWGTPIDVRSHAVAHPNDSFVVAYERVPSKACVELASSVAANVYDLRVGGASVLGADGLDPAATASACGGGATMEFVYFSGLSSGEAVATPGLTLPTAPPSVDPANPVTPTAPVEGAPAVDDAVPGTPGTVQPGTPVAPPPMVPPAPPGAVSPTTPQPVPGGSSTNPPALNRCVAPAGTTTAQTIACPAGQYGQIFQERAGVYSCPEAWADPVLTWGAWGPAGGSCTTCPTPGQEATTQWVGASAACPSGQTGAHTWEKEQRATRDYSYSCPAGTTSLPAPSYGGWSGWSDTGNRRNEVNTCTAPAVQCDYKTRTDIGPVTTLNPLPWTPLRSCDASTIGMRAYATVVSCGGAGCGGTYRALECTASGWNVVAGAGSVPYVGWNVANPQPQAWTDLQIRGGNDWHQQTVEAGGVTGLVSRSWTTYSCPPY